MRGMLGDFVPRTHLACQKSCRTHTHLATLSSGCNRLQLLIIRVSVDQKAKIPEILFRQDENVGLAQISILIGRWYLRAYPATQQKILSQISIGEN